MDVEWYIEPCLTPHVTGDERDKCGGIEIEDVQGKYEVNQWREREDMPNQLETRCSKIEWSRISKAAERSRRQRQDIYLLVKDSIWEMVILWEKCGFGEVVFGVSRLEGVK